MLEDLEPRGVSATAECCCAEAGVGLVSPLSQSAQTTKAQNLFSVQQGKAIQPAIVQKGRKLRSETGKNATRSQSSHGQNKLSRHRQQKQAKGGNTVCFCSKLCVNLCVFFTFGAGGRVCVCVTANVFLVCYWTSKRGLCLKSVFYWEPTKRGERGKQCNQRGQNCLDDKETITSLN